MVCLPQLEMLQMDAGTRVQPNDGHYHCPQLHFHTNKKPFFETLSHSKGLHIFSIVSSVFLGNGGMFRPYLDHFSINVDQIDFVVRVHRGCFQSFSASIFSRKKWICHQDVWELLASSIVVAYIWTTHCAQVFQNTVVNKRLECCHHSTTSIIGSWRIYPFLERVKGS
mgnify:CR=1 FL=1